MKVVTETFYSTDISASGMNKTMCDWNLAKFVQLPNNILKYLRRKIPGVTSPMMRHGSVSARSSKVTHLHPHLMRDEEVA